MGDIDSSKKLGPCHFSGGGIIQMVILQLLHEKSDHGYQLMQRIQEVVGSNYIPESGTIYTLLRRLENRGYLNSEWDAANSNVDRRIYTLTRTGELQLRQGLKMMKLRHPILDYLIAYHDTYFLHDKIEK